MISIGIVISVGLAEDYRVCRWSVAFRLTHAHAYKFSYRNFLWTESYPLCPTLPSGGIDLWHSQIICSWNIESQSNATYVYFKFERKSHAILAHVIRWEGLLPQFITERKKLIKLYKISAFYVHGFGLSNAEKEWRNKCASEYSRILFLPISNS